ncbi:MAG: GNAT family N-acetyltransferase [Nitrososphaeria archaeon]
MPIRKATESDIQSLTNMFTKMYQLNSEFDPMLQVVDDLGVKVEKMVKEALVDKNSFIYVYEEEGEIWGAVKIKLVDRVFYVPQIVAQIEEFYVHPAKRRSTIGRQLIEYAESDLRKIGIKVLMARFPSKNIIATSFYTKNGFREVHNEYGKLI